MSRFCRTVWRRLNGRDIVVVCSRACSVKNLPDGKPTGPLGRRLCGAMSWRSVRSAVGGGVPLDVRLVLTWEPRNLGSEWPVQVSAQGSLLYAGMSGGVLGPRGIDTVAPIPRQYMCDLASSFGQFTGILLSHQHSNTYLQDYQGNRNWQCESVIGRVGHQRRNYNEHQYIYIYI